MTLQKFFFGMGIWVAVLPYLGFPSTTDRVLYILSGALLMYAAYKMKTVTAKIEVTEYSQPKRTISRPRVKKETERVVSDMIPVSEEFISPSHDEESKEL